jgi:hypothetical protein
LNIPINSNVKSFDDVRRALQIIARRIYELEANAPPKNAIFMWPDAIGALKIGFERTTAPDLGGKIIIGTVAGELPGPVP